MTPEGTPLLLIRQGWIGSHLERDFEEEVEADEEEISFQFQREPMRPWR